MDKVSNVFREKFDVVYCFRSTWQFSDIEAAIDFMLFFVATGGVVVFDIMNQDSVFNKNFVRKKNITFPITLFKNGIKSVINIFSPNRFMLDKLFGVHDIMYKPEEISKFLTSKNLEFRTLNLLDVNRKGGGGDIDVFGIDQKVVFVVRC